MKITSTNCMPVLDISDISNELSEKIRKAIAKYFFNIEDVVIGQKFIVIDCNGKPKKEFYITLVESGFYSYDDENGYRFYLEGENQEDYVELQFWYSFGENGHPAVIEPNMCIGIPDGWNFGDEIKIVNK